MSAMADALTCSARVAEGDDAFASAVAANQRRVFAIAYSVVGIAADAEEVAQDVFLRL